MKHSNKTIDVTPLARTDVFAAYGPDHLPVVALDERGRPLVLTKPGNLVLATKANVGGYSFDEVVTR
jgi:hypothetical protein